MQVTYSYVFYVSTVNNKIKILFLFLECTDSHPTCAVLYKACLSVTDYKKTGAEVFESITTDNQNGNIGGKKHGEAAVSRKKRCSRKHHGSGVALVLLGAGGHRRKGCEDSDSSSSEEKPDNHRCDPAKFKHSVRWLVTAVCPKTCNVCEAVKSKDQDCLLNFSSRVCVRLEQPMQLQQVLATFFDRIKFN